MIFDSSPGRYDFSFWDKSTKLLIFGKEARVNAAGIYEYNMPNYAGSLYLLAFYKRELSASEIKQNYNAKIRRNTPIVLPQTVSLRSCPFYYSRHLTFIQKYSPNFFITDKFKVIINHIVMSACVGFFTLLLCAYLLLLLFLVFCHFHKMFFVVFYFIFFGHRFF